MKETETTTFEIDRDYPRPLPMVSEPDYREAERVHTSATAFGSFICMVIPFTVESLIIRKTLDLAASLFSPSSAAVLTL